MNRPANRNDAFVRALAAVFAVGITSLIVAVHAADLSTLGGQDASNANVAAVATSKAQPRGA
jgi:hypothetical protein